MTDLISKHFTEIIGLLGTLLGVLLGAFLNKISKFGRIKFYLNNVSFSLLERSDSGGYNKTQKIKKQTELLHISIDFDLINTSEYSRKILRDVKFVATDQKSKNTTIFKDNSTRKNLDYMIKVDDLKHINLQPKEIRNFNLSVYFKKDFDKILKSNWHIEYRTQNNKVQKFKIKKKDMIQHYV
ncbi:hypothetical protein [Tenacibaculum larymnensis]|uniref:Uncharacterized protein n=1 Tax=Tenacibaculum larymnensis TaxID=2878201 RepID=A0A9X4IN00_9FLAO|nr:hypothetical protein [Tenacibaculum larymnensis]MDE1205210.1 hypothetical protein [Tenacibaculum larymnensis]